MRIPPYWFVSECAERPMDQINAPGDTAESAAAYGGVFHFGESIHRATVVASIGETVFLSEISIRSAGLTVSHFIEAEFAR
jgi:hypothetical protein